MNVFLIQFLGLFIFVLILFVATITLQGELQRRALLQREQGGNIPDREEFEQIYNQSLLSKIFLGVLFFVGLMLGIFVHSLYTNYYQHQAEFSSWIQKTYNVPVDEQRADKVECYLGALHYPEKYGSALIPYASTISCDQTVFDQKKSQLNLTDATEKLKLWSFGVMLIGLIFFMLLAVYQLMFRPKFVWASHVRNSHISRELKSS